MWRSLPRFIANRVVVHSSPTWSKHTSNARLGISHTANHTHTHTHECHTQLFCNVIRVGQVHSGAGWLVGWSTPPLSEKKVPKMGVVFVLSYHFGVSTFQTISSLLLFCKHIIRDSIRMAISLAKLLGGINVPCSMFHSCAKASQPAECLQSLKWIWFSCWVVGSKVCFGWHIRHLRVY